jgi:hypothetical protein
MFLWVPKYLRMLDALGACFMDQLMGLKDKRECGPKLHKSKCVNPRDECFVWMIFVYLFMLDKDTRVLHSLVAVGREQWLCKWRNRRWNNNKT